MSLEHDLRQALKRKEPPAGFSERVLNKIASSEVHGSSTPASWRRFALPVVASLMLVAGGSYAVQRLEFGMAVARLKPSPTDVQPSPTEVTPSAREQNARAAHDVVLALQIASAKVSAAQAKVQERTHHERHNDH